MKDEAAEVRRALGVLRDPLVSVDDAKDSHRRERLVPSLLQRVEQLQTARQRRRRSAAILGGIAAAATLALIGTAILHRDEPIAASGTPHALRLLSVEGELTYEQGTHRTTPVAGSLLAQGALSTSEQGAATLRTQDDVLLELGERTLIDFSELVSEGTLKLERGSVTCTVPPLGDQRIFAVATPTARVVVHGTVFSVDVAADGRTCVEVAQGVVSVHHEAGSVRLKQGDAWNCDERSAPEVNRQQTAPRQAPSVRRRPVRATAPTTHPRQKPSPSDDAGSTTLANETALLESAIAAERRGQRGAAIAALKTLLRTYPASPLAPEAKRILQRLETR